MLYEQDALDMVASAVCWQRCCPDSDGNTWWEGDLLLLLPGVAGLA
jgi:hypothetical protein